MIAFMKVECDRGITWNVHHSSPSRESDEEKETHLLRAYSVFHASQVEGLPPYVAPGIEEAPWTRPEAVQFIIENCGVPFKTGGDKPFYSPAGDFIQMPPVAAFAQP